jgi:hypothetical protein
MRRRLVLAGQLAGRLAEGGPEYRAASTLASIVAADLEKVVDTWVQVRVLQGLKNYISTFSTFASVF